MNLHRSISRTLSFLLCIGTCQIIYAGPVIRSSRMVREIYPEVEQDIPDNTSTQACIVGDVVYHSGASIPSEQPCLKCSCTWGEVRCEAEACAAPRGCKAITRPGKCCPAYQCECIHQGKVYANGERLPQTPGHDCSVCYCRGGHVQCAEVGCYTRDDCQPKYVKGQCCPKYDHCPPRDPLSDRITSGTSPTFQNLEPELISTWSQSKTNLTSEEEGSGDDAFVMNDDPRRSSTPVTFSIKEIESKTNSKRNDNIQNTMVDKNTQTDPETKFQITIQEVIPQRSEFIPHKAVSISPINAVTYKNQEMSSTNSPVNQLTDSSNELLSENTEIYNHPVLRIGDQLLFIKQGQLIPEKDASTPSPVITLIGAEGLQIGLGSEELIEQDVTTVSSVVSSTTNVEEYISEENPYYPPIPEDIMNLRNNEEFTTDVTSNTKILPDVLQDRNNDTINNNTKQEWLKKQSPTKISIPLMNEKATIPNALLEMTAFSDLNSDENESTTQKSDKIVSENFELFESAEYTTISNSNEDASVDIIQNDSSPVDNTDFVEIVPGFESVTEKIIQTKQTPIEDVEIINLNTENKKTREEIQKRDVVKKVLKDIFENPNENIRIDVVENTTTNLILENEEQNNLQLSSNSTITTFENKIKTKNN